MLVAVLGVKMHTGVSSSLLPVVALMACTVPDPGQRSGASTAADVERLASAAARVGSTGGDATEGRPPNILLVIADDVGIDQSGCYSSPVESKAPQPNLEALCARGLTFTQAWANPYCSPTRAGMLTGRDSRRTGVGEPTGLLSLNPGLSRHELTLPRALDRADSGYRHAAFGKWHLADANNGGLRHPNIAGFQRFVGGIEGHVDDYYEWPRVVDGVVNKSTTYVTSATVDDAVDWITDQDGPWFAWVAFHAGHWPRHLPPTDLHSYDRLSGSAADLAARPEVYYQAMVESMDTEMGRLFDELGPETMRNTIVIYVGDNGTEAVVNQNSFPAEHAKGTLYQGGVRVPLVVAGPGVMGRGRREDAPVHTVDMFATVLDLAGVDVADFERGRIVDSVSMAPYLWDPEAPDQREFVLSEVFGGASLARGTTGQAISDGHHKLIRLSDGEEQLYDIEDDFREDDDLLSGGVMSAYENMIWETLADRLDHLPIDPASAEPLSTYGYSGDGDTGGADTGEKDSGEKDTGEKDTGEKDTGDASR